MNLRYFSNLVQNLESLLLRDAVLGARHAEAEIVWVIQRGCEYRATTKCARKNKKARLL